MAEINLHCNSENLQVIKRELESVIDENVTYITGPVLYTLLPCTHRTGKVSHDSEAGDNRYCQQRYSETDEISTWR